MSCKRCGVKYGVIDCEFKERHKLLEKLIDIAMDETNDTDCRNAARSNIIYLYAEQEKFDWGV